MKRRMYGQKIDFKSLSCAPINEMGVVYLFGVLHAAFDFKIESIQAGFPDCIARRHIGNRRYEEVRIEFEFESKNFATHGHDPDGVDIIVCWQHNWPNCPAKIEIIELSKLLQDVQIIVDEIGAKPKKLSEYNKYCQELRIKGYSFSEIAIKWREQKRTKGENS